MAQAIVPKKGEGIVALESPSTPLNISVSLGIQTVSINITNTWKVVDVINEISRWHDGISPDDYELTSKGIPLERNKSLAFYGIQNESRLVLKKIKMTAEKNNNVLTSPSLNSFGLLNLYINDPPRFWQSSTASEMSLDETLKKDERSEKQEKTAIEKSQKTLSPSFSANPPSGE
jgi:hypothetical protein